MDFNIRKVANNWKSGETVSVPYKNLGICNFVIIGNNLWQDSRLRNALETYNSTCCFSNTGLEYIGDRDAVFVMEDFSWDLFQQLKIQDCRIVGPTLILQSIGMQLPLSKRPLYCTSMQGIVVCLCKTTDRAEIIKKIQYMGGYVRKDMCEKITHLITTTSALDKYKSAISLGKCVIMREEWVDECWRRKSDNTFKADQPDIIIEYRWLPFHKCLLSFIGFSREEMSIFKELTKNNGGHVDNTASCTHMVVNEQSPPSLKKAHSDCSIVTSSWFWASIQMEACADVSMYLYTAPEHAVYDAQEINGGWDGEMRGRGVNDGDRDFDRKDDEWKSAGRYGGGGEKLKGEGKDGKKERKNDYHDLYNEYKLEPTHGEIKKKVNLQRCPDDNVCYTEGNGIDNEDLDQTIVDKPKEIPAKEKDKRLQVISELYQTENNYVNILNVLLDLYKKGLEAEDQPGGAILNPMETKAIFSGVVDLSLLHTNVLRELRDVVDGRKDCVGEIFNRRVEQFAKVYPSFINYLQTTKQTIAEYRKTKPRFQAFLMLCQKRVECRRQSLEDLLVRPVQRLPSVLLILKDLYKRTNNKHSDHLPLQQAIKCLDNVIMHINEEKRKVDMHLGLFDVLEGIEGGQARFFSAHRNFVEKLSVEDVCGKIGKKQEVMSLYLFNDCVAICRKKLKKEKILKDVDFRYVQRVLDVTCNKNSRNLFAMLIWSKDSESELFVFNLEETSPSKQDFLSTLAHHICITTDTPNYNAIMGVCHADDLGLETDYSGQNTITKTLRRMTRNLSWTRSSKKDEDSSSSGSGILRGGSSVSDDSCRSSVDWSGSVRSCVSDKDSYNGLAGMLDETLVVSEKKATTLTHSMNDLTSNKYSQSPQKKMSSLRRNPFVS